MFEYRRIAANPFQHANGQRREGVGLSTRLDERQTGTRMRDASTALSVALSVSKGENHRRRPRAGNRDVYAHPACRRVAPQLFANRARIAQQAAETADVDRHEIGAMHFVARRELAGDGQEAGPFRAAVLIVVRTW